MKQQNTVGLKVLALGSRLYHLLSVTFWAKKKLLNISKLEFLYLKHGIIILIT